MIGKLFFAFLLVGGLCTASYARDTTVRGYYRNDGQYVAPHYRSAPNSYKWDNYSSYPNRNPYTGKKGYAPNELHPYGADRSRGKSYYDYNFGR